MRISMFVFRIGKLIEIWLQCRKCMVGYGKLRNTNGKQRGRKMNSYIVKRNEIAVKIDGNSSIDAVERLLRMVGNAHKVVSCHVGYDANVWVITLGNGNVFGVRQL